MGAPSLIQPGSEMGFRRIGRSSILFRAQILDEGWSSKQILVSGRRWRELCLSKPFFEVWIIVRLSTRRADDLQRVGYPVFHSCRGVALFSKMHQNVSRSATMSFTVDNDVEIHVGL